MAEKEQVKPLAPSYLFRSYIDADMEAKSLHAARRRKTYVKCCGCAAAIIVITAVALIILAFTLFHVRGLTIRVITLSGASNLAAAAAGDNVTLVAEVSIRNPNAGTFRYKDAPTTVFYGGQAVGSGRSPGRAIGPRSTVRANVTMEVAPSEVLAAPRFADDVAAGALRLESFTRIEGRVKIANIVKRNIVVEMNCTIMYDIAFKQVNQRPNCKSNVL